MMGTFLPSNILLTPWPSANTMLSSRANTSYLSWQNEPVCIKMRVNGKQKEPTKVPSLLYFCLKDKICIFWCFLPAHHLQKAPKHPHNRVVRCFRNISFRSYDDNKLSVPNNFNTILFWWGEWHSNPINTPLPEAKFLLKMFLFSSSTEVARAGGGFVGTKFLFSGLEMGFFSLYPFLLVPVPNNISWPWSAQPDLQENSSALYSKTKYWPKPVFLSRLPWVDRYCGTWSLCVSACKKPQHKYFNRVRRLFCMHFWINTNA